MKEEKENISDLILLNYLKGDVSTAEKAMVEKWLNKGSANKLRLDQLAKAWKHSESVTDLANIDVEKDWEKVKMRMKFENKNSKHVSVKTRGLFYFISRIAAVLLIIIGVSYIIYQYGFGDDSGMIIIKTFQNKTDLELADGTKVFLNKNSTLSYPEKFNKKSREVNLNGEAYFEVARNEDLPFIVNIPEGAEVYVLGTAFNINTNDHGNTVVNVSRGEVALFSPTNVHGPIFIRKGEMGVLSEGKLTKSKDNFLNYLSWKTGILNFINAPIEKVIADLSDYYDTTIILKNNKLKYKKLTTLVYNQTLDDVLEELKLVLNVNYSNTDGSILIFKDD